MLISLHLPKTAGMSFGQALEEHFGETFMKDYEDFPINTPSYVRNRHALEQSIINAEKDWSSVKCIHGHFLPLKYLLLHVRQPMRFITWMRDPVERVLSHYYYWKRAYNPLNAPVLWRRMVEEDWSIERLCLGPEVKNFYAQFLWGFPMAYFDFIGITEFYKQDLEYLSHNILGFKLDEKIVNVREEKGMKYDIPLSFREELKRHHDIDMLIFKKALERRRDSRR